MSINYNSIIATGYPKFSAEAFNDKIKFDYQSVIIGEYAGRDIKLLSSEALIRSYENTFIGYKAGQASIDASKNIFIGFEAGINVRKGSYNIIIGKEYDTGLSRIVDNSISLGFTNNTYDNSISLGTSNNNKGNYNAMLGFTNSIQGNQNIILGNNNYASNIQNSIIIGNDIVYDSKLHQNVILLGNELYNDKSYLINIGNTIVKKDDDVLFLGYQANLPVAIGYNTYDDTAHIQSVMNSNAYSLYSKSGIYTSNVISIGNISLKANVNTASNIEYILPDYPADASNVVLSTNANGELFWQKASFDTPANNIRTTDELPQGTSNLYFNTDLNRDMIIGLSTAIAYENFNTKFPLYFNTHYESKLAQLNLDQIQNGINNKYIKNGVLNQDLIIFGTLTVNKLQVIGIETKHDNNFSTYIADILANITNTSNALMQTISLLDNRLRNIEEKLS